MNADRKGILLNTDFSLRVQAVRGADGKIVSGLVIGKCIDQEAAMVLRLQKGELKEQPLLGCGLTRFMRGKYDKTQVESVIRTNFTLAGIDYDAYKKRIQIVTKTTE